MHAIKETVVIMSACKSNRTDFYNTLFTRRLKMHLQKMTEHGLIRFSAAVGRYHCEQEQAFVIVIQTPRDSAVLDVLMSFGMTFDQESILVADESGVHLHFMQYFTQPWRCPERIGSKLVKVEFDGDRRPDAYTYFNGEAWVAK